MRLDIRLLRKIFPIIPLLYFFWALLIMAQYFRYRLLKDFFSFKFTVMLRWAVTFLIIAIVAAFFGFGGIAAGAASFAKILFFIFIVLFLLSLIFGKWPKK